MANDRLYFCSSTGRKVLIAKHFCDSWSVFHKNLPDLLNDIFDKDFLVVGRAYYYLATENADLPFKLRSYVDDCYRLSLLVNEFASEIWSPEQIAKEV